MNRIKNLHSLEEFLLIAAQRFALHGHSQELLKQTKRGNQSKNITQTFYNLLVEDKNYTKNH